MGDQLLGRADRLEVRLGQDVRLLAGRGEPAEEVDVVLAPLRRDAAPDEHAAEAGGALGALGVPGVAPAVAVGVAEVVRLPRVRRHHDGDAAPLAERRRPDHEGRVADPSVVRGQLDEVDTRRPGAERPVQRRAAVPRLPLDRHRLVDGNAVHQRVAVRARVLAACAEGLQRQRGGVGLDRQPGGARGDVALGREARVDAEHADDRRAELAALARVVGAVGAPVAGAVEGAEADQVRARPDRPVREPGERVPARLQVRPELVDRRRRAERPRHLEVHLRRPRSGVKPILADSRSSSPFGEIVVRRSLSPWNGIRSRLRARMFVSARRRLVDAERRGGEDAEAVDEADRVGAVPDARAAAQPAVPAEVEEAAALGRRRSSRARGRPGGPAERRRAPRLGSAAWIRRRFAFGEKSCGATVKSAAAAGGTTARARTSRTRRRIGRES